MIYVCTFSILATPLTATMVSDSAGVPNGRDSECLSQTMAGTSIKKFKTFKLVIGSECDVTIQLPVNTDTEMFIFGKL